MTKQITFKFRAGKIYETLEGKKVKVLRHTHMKGYECVVCSDGIHRYDRSTHSGDAGRVRGTDHNYTCRHNFKVKGKNTCYYDAKGNFIIGNQSSIWTVEHSFEYIAAYLKNIIAKMRSTS